MIRAVGKCLAFILCVWLANWIGGQLNRLVVAKLFRGDEESDNHDSLEFVATIGTKDGIDYNLEDKDGSLYLIGFRDDKPVTEPVKVDSLATAQQIFAN